MSVSRTTAAAAVAVVALAVGLPLPAARADTAAPVPSAVPAAVPAALSTAVPASPGRASAVTAELRLDVSLLDKAADVPVDIALNKVETPAQSAGTLLTAKVDGVDRERPVTLVDAEAGKSVTRADAHGTAASVTLVGAAVHAPGLPLTALLGLDALSASVTCPVDGPPTAQVGALARVTVLGRSVKPGLYGPTHVDVPGIGSVDLQFSRHTTTSTTAAASALEVQVALNPLNLNVAKVTGRITVASVSCEKPTAGSAAPSTAPAVQPSAGPSGLPAPASVQAGRALPAADARSLAFTGSSGTGTLLAGSGVLLAVGAAALRVTRRRRAHRR
ncbi:SCO1860 family LAETG-anchored protein [Kitasatospora kazusensis]|uniref:SCO1860 family LAETG-anchored protein n=1 Tax=Kitasatospora kazusensis TaxID=407974 RepID=A0ABN3A3A7_9ACTN